MKHKRLGTALCLSITVYSACIHNAHASGGWYVFPLDPPDAVYEPDQLKACKISLERANYIIYNSYHPDNGKNVLDNIYMSMSQDGSEQQLNCVHHNIGPDAVPGTQYIMTATWRCPGRGSFKPQNRSCDLKPSTNVKPNKNYCEADRNQSVGDPINLGSSALEEDVIDFETSGPTPLRVKRLYRSQSMPGNLLGEGNWKFDFEYMLSIWGDTAYFYTPQGEQYSFTKDNNGNFTVVNKEGPIYLTNSSGFYNVKMPDGNQLMFGGNPRNSIGYGPANLLQWNRNDGLVLYFGYKDNNTNFTPTYMHDQFDRTIYFSNIGGTSTVNKIQYYISGKGAAFQVDYNYTYKSDGDIKYNEMLSSVRRSAASDPSDSSTFAAVNSVSYAYEDDSNPSSMTSFVDERGIKISSWSYDSSKRPTSSTVAGSLDKTTVQYGTNTDSRSVVNSLGRSTNYNFNILNGNMKLTSVSSSSTANVPQSSRSILYDGNGNIASVTDEENRVTSFIRDQYGRPTTITQGK